MACCTLNCASVLRLRPGQHLHFHLDIDIDITSVPVAKTSHRHQQQVATRLDTYFPLDDFALLTIRTLTERKQGARHGATSHPIALYSYPIPRTVYARMHIMASHR